MPVGESVRWLMLTMLVLGGCRAEATQARAPKAVDRSSETELVRLRDEARLVLEENCGRCHTSHYDSANEMALTVFDLAEAEWAQNMSEAQLENAAWRLTQDLAPGGHDGVEMNVPPELREAFVKYKDALLAARQMSAL